MIQRNEILTTDEALAMICRSKSWFYAHCNESDFPRRIYWTMAGRNILSVMNG